VTPAAKRFSSVVCGVHAIRNPQAKSASAWTIEEVVEVERTRKG
jgi:hypothetical protein